MKKGALARRLDLAAILIGDLLLHPYPHEMREMRRRIVAKFPGDEAGARRHFKHLYCSPEEFAAAVARSREAKREAGKFLKQHAREGI